ncbi:transposase, partial [Methylibium rhizosphaerae]|uniref:transposase n=1 Tax=Methylibium rhizosphaerae TaxID=2570323 RepID=UPI001C6121A7
MIADDPLDTLDPEQLREALRAVRAEMALTNELLVRREREVAFKQTIIDKLTHENAVLKRLKFAAKSEAYTAEQKSLLEETLDMDLAAVAAEIEALQPRPEPADEKKPPKRAPLPPHLPRR